MKQLNLKIKYPQNYIIRRPVTGTFILFLFSIGFTLLYHPMNTHKSIYFSFEFTMLLYSLSNAVVAGLSIFILKKIPFFSKIENWTIGKEIASIYIVLQILGIAIYFLGFAIEQQSNEGRWNLFTFLDSCKHSFLIYIFPFAFFSIVNYKFLFLNFESTINKFQEEKHQKHTINIRSQLKKESLSFQANELLYAVSDGNYVVFHLYKNNELKKIPVRNSISDIETQLKDIPSFLRCHRGFIVNLSMVESKKGNSSGYLLRIKHCKNVIPVSRNKTKRFNQFMETPPQ
ncbi:MAG: LytTR family transcriptional regulator [Prolixibacteraceae bacterium]|nr:LytTR family transcriptional regulator [Prolixibacteraceae bacterium]